MAKIQPTNLEIVTLDQATVKYIGEVKTGQIHDNSGNFHPEGLFSTTIFGPVGSNQRLTTFGKIELHATVLHPLIYETIVKLKAFYKSILDGSATAIFDKKLKDFIPSNSPEASTGFTFFISNLPDIRLELNDSEQREFRVKLINKAIKDKSLTIEQLLVLPAGLRDYVVDKSGKPQEDEINTLYRRVLAQSALIDPVIFKSNPEVYDKTLIGLQRSISDIKEYLDTLLEGKNKLILGKWLSRKTFNSTRNVISGHVDKSTTLQDPSKQGYNDTLVGLHQFARVLAPKSLYEIKNKYIASIFPSNSQSVFLTNVTTLKKEEVLNSSIQKEYDLWTSPDGLEKVIATLGNFDLRLQPILLNKDRHYMGLLYKDKVMFKFFQDIDELPENLDKKNVTPISLFEFLYISLYPLSKRYCGFNTRYPITGYGSIFPVTIVLKPTIRTRPLVELDANWEVPSEDDKDKIAVSFPVLESGTLDSMVIPDSHLAAAGGDFDGDTMSLTAVLTDEANEEIKAKFNSLNYYLDEDSKLRFSQETDTLKGVFANIT